MATKKDTGKPHGGPVRKRVEDPAPKYYEQSRRDREEYKKALKTMSNESSWSFESLPERHHDILNHDGNANSRSSFDYRNYHSKP